MIQGIAIIGLNGGGKSTLAHALAKQTDYFEMDVEDYYFPEQSISRKCALENKSFINTEHLSEVPYSNPRTKYEVETAILEDIRTHPKFILSGVTMNWTEEILSRINIAFWVQTPLEERLRRIQGREEKRFGMRVLSGGDMFTQQMEFRKMVENRDLEFVEESVKKLSCPVILIDGTLSVTKNIEIIIDNMNDL